MKAINDALEIIFGDKTGGYYLAAFFFSGLGLIISLWQSSKKRNPLSPNTPKRFSWIFMLWDNAKRAFVTIIVEFILFRAFDLSNILLMVGVGVSVGIAFDKLVEFIMSKSEAICQFLSMNREKWPDKPKEV